MNESYQLTDEEALPYLVRQKPETAHQIMSAHPTDTFTIDIGVHYHKEMTGEEASRLMRSLSKKNLLWSLTWSTE